MTETVSPMESSVDQGKTPIGQLSKLNYLPKMSLQRRKNPDKYGWKKNGEAW